ncbi:MAG: hypothetical protein SNJ57_18815 [Cyanobacteriota bacterium]
MLKDYDPGDRRPVKFHATITLLQSLSHISRSVGNEAEFKSLKLTDLTGDSSEIFVYSGNSLRNGKTGRRSGMMSFFDAVDIDVLKAEHQVFFSGGYLDGAGVSDLEWENKIRKFFPYLSLIGSAVPSGALGLKGSTMIPGRIAFGDAYLCCFEAAEYLYRLFPPALPHDCLEGVQAIAQAKHQWETDRKNAHFEKRQPDEALKRQWEEAIAEWLPLLQGKLKLATQYLEYREKPRHPSLKDGNLTKYLRGADTPKLKGDKEEAKKATGQMISGTWTLHPGAQLYSQWASLGSGITDLEEGALVDALLKFGERPYLGGQSGSGCGLCSMEIWYETPDSHGHWLTIAPDGVQNLSDRAADTHTRYRELLGAYRQYFEEVKAGQTVESQELRNLLLGGAA